MNTYISKFRTWVLKYGYAIDSMSVMWYFNQRGKVYRSNGDIIVSIGKTDHKLEDIADQFIEGARR